VHDDVVASDVTIYTTDSSFTDSTASFSSVTCVRLRAKMCSDGSVALTTSTSSYTADVYELSLEAAPNTAFGVGSKIYAK